MRSESASWTARASKHAGVGYPLVTVLLCLEDAPSFGQFVDTLVDNLHRQLKARFSLSALDRGQPRCSALPARAPEERLRLFLAWYPV